MNETTVTSTRTATAMMIRKGDWIVLSILPPSGTVSEFLVRVFRLLARRLSVLSVVRVPSASCALPPCHGQHSSRCEWMHITTVFPIGRSCCEPLHNREHNSALWCPMVVEGSESADGSSRHYEIRVNGGRTIPHCDK